MEFFSTNISISALACLICILTFGVWTLLDQAIAGPNRIGELLRNEIMATLAGIGICVLSFLTLAVDDGWVGKVASSCLGMLGVVAHLFLEPQEASFWGRPRVRKIFLFALAVGTIAFTLFVPKPWLIPVVFAGFIYHRHRQCMLNSMSTSLTDLEAVKTKVLSYEATLRAQQQLGLPLSPADTHKTTETSNLVSMHHAKEKAS